ncbi:hypothetical protein I2485_01965 [Nesterenkonia sp. E16_7]|uniref:hypothetical protein n=1 Tax=unclassified Nesterenkonia TaxID=2629769 RepID=UPI001A91DB8B|nr:MULTISPECIES: hypothetical protein [unclassified Nesterenkonia]MBO0596358.1 hypothetical protein [Nesterenkonia sp. E16_10]MBO0597414.1 hypothetical protein [Nesterenkonia sp. E16_7]
MSSPAGLDTGTIVNLKTDKEKRPWEIEEMRDNGTIAIVRTGRPKSIYTTMHVTASRLQRAVAQR